MHISTKIALISTVFFALSATAYAGESLTNKDGMTLYTFDKDKENESVCYGGCAIKWPPYIAKAGAKLKAGWGLVERKDGSQQWTYNDQPLYTWIGDTKVGDTTGDGVGGVWHTAKKSKSASYQKSSDSSYSYGY